MRPLIELREKLEKAEDALKHAKKKKEKQDLTLLLNDLRERIGSILLADGDYGNSFAIYQSLSWKTHGEQKYHGICATLIEMERYNVAGKLLHRGLKRFPESPRLLNAMGVLHRRLGFSNAALQYIEKALLQDPENCATLFNKANVLYSLSLYEEAISIYRKCSEKNPDEPYHFAMIGRCYLGMGYPEKAVKYFKSALDLDHLPEAYAGLYWAYKGMGLSNEAREIAEKGLRRFPHEDPCLYLNLANSYYNRGWLDEAKEVLQRGLIKFPGDEDMEKYLKEIEDDSDDPKKGSNLPILLAIILNNIRQYRKEY